MALDMTGPVVVRLPVEIDMVNCEAVCEQLRLACSPGVTAVIADLTSTVFCDSAGVRGLIIAYRFAAGRDTQLRLAAAHPSMARILEVTGADQLMPVYPSLAAAMAGSGASLPQHRAPG